MGPLKTIKKMSVRLLRKGRGIEDALTPTFAPSGKKPLARERWPNVTGAETIYGQIYQSRPSWTAFVADGLYAGEAVRDRVDEQLSALESRGAGCAIFVPVRDRVVAACFGTIHLALNDDAFERQFGLKVALNAVPRSGLRTLDLATPDAVTFQRRIQASKDSDLGDFGVDPVRDLARVAGGTPRDETFARFVAGRDSLSISSEVSADSLQRKCDDVLAMYGKKTYQDEYPWVDQLSRVQEKDVIERLDKRLFAAICDLRDKRHADLYLAPPEIVDYMAGTELRYSGFGRVRTSFARLAIEDYVAELEARSFTGDIDTIKRRHRVETVVGDSGEFAQKWRVYSCFVFETALSDGDEGLRYILSAGSWHRVTESFQRSVDEFFGQIERRSVIGETYCKNEKELIKNLEATRRDLLSLDRVRINPPGAARAQIEPCDFLSHQREFIHIKDGESSGRISHLWSQGLVSADALVEDESFIRDIRKEVRRRNHTFLKALPRNTTEVERGKYVVVFAIMRRPYRNGSVGIPFFSKVSVQAPARYIRKLGFTVAVELVPKRDGSP